MAECWNSYEEEHTAHEAWRKDCREATQRLIDRPHDVRGLSGHFRNGHFFKGIKPSDLDLAYRDR